MRGGHPLLGVSKGDEYGGVGELEDGADGVDGGDEDDAVRDEGQAVPHADEAVEKRVDVGHTRELLRGSIPNDPPECRPARHEMSIIASSALDRLRVETWGKICILEINNLTKEKQLNQEKGELAGNYSIF